MSIQENVHQEDTQQTIIPSKNRESPSQVTTIILNLVWTIKCLRFLNDITRVQIHKHFCESDQDLELTCSSVQSKWYIFFQFSLTSLHCPYQTDEIVSHAPLLSAPHVIYIFPLLII